MKLGFISSWSVDPRRHGPADRNQWGKSQRHDFLKLVLNTLTYRHAHLIKVM